MEILLVLLTLHQDPVVYAEPQQVAPVTLPYDAEPEELEAESTGGTY